MSLAAQKRTFDDQIQKMVTTHAQRITELRAQTTRYQELAEFAEASEARVKRNEESLLAANMSWRTKVCLVLLYPAHAGF